MSLVQKDFHFLSDMEVMKKLGSQNFFREKIEGLHNNHEMI